MLIVLHTVTHLVAFNSPPSWHFEPYCRGEERSTDLIKVRKLLSEEAQDRAWDLLTLYDFAEGSVHKSLGGRGIPGRECSVRETRVFCSDHVICIGKSELVWVSYKGIFLLGREL